MPAPDFLIRQGDTNVPLASTLEDENGNAVSIQAATVRFHMSPINGSGTPLLDAAATNGQTGDGSDGSKGHVTYTWQSGDTSVSGWYLAEWQVTYACGAVETFPNGGYVLIYITPQVA